MKRFYPTYVIVLLMMVTVHGCSYTRGLTTGSGKAPDQELYKQVPASMRKEVREAEFDLKETKASLGNTREKLKLAELLQERSREFTEMRQLEFKEAEYLQKEAEIELDIRKWEAIANSNLGDQAQIVKTIGDLKSEKLNNEAARVKVQASVTNTKLRIKELDKQIQRQRSKIKQ
jgi:hypothetical protein